MNPSTPTPAQRLTCICGVHFSENNTEALKTHADCPKQRFINDKCPKCGNKDHYHVCKLLMGDAIKDAFDSLRPFLRHNGQCSIFAGTACNCGLLQRESKMIDLLYNGETR